MPVVPTRKVGAGTLAGALTVLVVWGIGPNGFGHVVVPPEIASVVTTLLTGLVGYFVPEADQ